MPSIRLLRNGIHLASDGGADYSSLDWEVTASRFDATGATLRLSGLMLRADGNYDSHYWLEDFPVEVGDNVTVEWTSIEEQVPFARQETHEVAEQLRRELHEAMQIAKENTEPLTPVQVLRPHAKLEVRVAGEEAFTALADQESDLVVCHGVWARDRKPNQWYLRLSTHPAGHRTSGVWHPTERSICVAVQA